MCTKEQKKPLPVVIFLSFLRKAAIHDVPSRVPCSSSINWLETVHVLVLLKVWQCSFYLSTAHILRSTACPPPLTPPVWYTPFFLHLFFKTWIYRFYQIFNSTVVQTHSPCSNSCTVKLEAPQVSTPSLKENHVKNQAKQTQRRTGL